MISKQKGFLDWLINWLIDEYLYIQTIAMSELTLLIELLDQSIMQIINKPIYVIL